MVPARAGDLSSWPSAGGGAGCPWGARARGGKGASRGVSRVETLSLVRGGPSGTSRACLSLLLPLLCLESLLNSRVEKEVQVQEG